MGRININNAGQYSQSQGNWFTLADDGDQALVTFLYESQSGDDIDYFLVHEVEIGGNTRTVNCLGVDEEGNLDPERCPLCQNGLYKKEKLYLQLYNHDTEQAEIWERGRTFTSQISNLVNLYGSLVTQPLLVTRMGRKGDSNTRYELTPEEPQLDATLDDFPEKQEILGSLIIDATEDDMYAMIDKTYVLPNASNNSDSSDRAVTSRRRTGSTNRQADSEMLGSARRGGAVQRSSVQRGGVVNRGTSTRTQEERPAPRRQAVERTTSQRAGVQRGTATRNTVTRRGGVTRRGPQQ